MSSKNLALFLDLLEAFDKIVLVFGNDSDEADIIRDEMDIPWYKLTNEEQDSLRYMEVAWYARNFN